jgi:hypothetical protein
LRLRKSFRNVPRSDVAGHKNVTRMELTEQTIEEIRALRCASDAQIIAALDSIGTVYWSDETTDAMSLLLFTESECEQIQKLFAIRARYWDTGTMGHDDQLYWEESRKQFPNWPIFQRLELSVEQRKALEVATEWREQLAEAVFSLADEIEVRTHDGSEFYSAIIHRDSFFKKTRNRAGWRFWHDWWSKRRGRAALKAASKRLNRKEKR